MAFSAALQAGNGTEQASSDVVTRTGFEPMLTA